VVTSTGFRAEGGSKFKGETVIGATATPVTIGAAGTVTASGAITGETTLTLGKSGGTSGQINFVASDNDQANIAINTSDQITFNGAAGGVVSDAPIGNTAQQTTTLGAGDVTFAVTKNVATITGHGDGNTIGTITGAVPGIYVFIFVDANITITDTDAAGANTIDLVGTATDLTSADDLTLTLVYDGTSWFEMSRSAN
jgi:hypothetical protein